MPIIDPGRPSASYLVYKALVGTGLWDHAGCASRYEVEVPGPCAGPSAQERARLRDWFVAGSAMPPGEGALDVAGLRVVRDWIRGGAPLDGCP